MNSAHCVAFDERALPRPPLSPFACLAGALISVQQSANKEVLHRKRQIGLNCAIDCGIRENDSNKNLIKYKNLFHVKSISNLVQRLARYRIVSLISIGRLCNFYL